MGDMITEDGTTQQRDDRHCAKFKWGKGFWSALGGCVRHMAMENGMASSYGSTTPHWESFKHRSSKNLYSSNHWYIVLETVIWRRFILEYQRVLQDTMLTPDISGARELGSTLALSREMYVHQGWESGGKADWLYLKFNSGVVDWAREGSGEIGKAIETNKAEGNIEMKIIWTGIQNDGRRAGVYRERKMSFPYSSHNEKVQWNLHCLRE